MRKVAVILTVVALLVAVAALAWSAKGTEAQKAGFVIKEVEATDGQLESLSKAVFNDPEAAWDAVLPRGWGLVQHEVKGKVIPHVVKHITVPRAWLRGSQAAAETDGRRAPNLYLFGSRLEDQVNETGQVFRPMFRGVTTKGSVVNGRSLRNLKADELRAVVRVIGNEITIITLN